MIYDAFMHEKENKESVFSFPPLSTLLWTVGRSPTPRSGHGENFDTGDGVHHHPDQTCSTMISDHPDQPCSTKIKHVQKHVQPWSIIFSLHNQPLQGFLQRHLPASRAALSVSTGRGGR